jgi:hypothetical protein
MKLSVIPVISIMIISILSCSCINDTYNSLSGERGKAVIRLTLSSDAMQTRSNAAITDGSGTTGTGESKVNNVCVGIFDGSGNTLTIHEYTYQSGNAEEIITTPDGKEMIIATNVPSSLFAGKKTKTDFLSVVQELGYTTSADGLSNSGATTVNSQQQTALPMYADVTGLSLSGTDVTSKEVTLTREVARITLSTVKVNFGSTAEFAGTTFVPEEIFMYQASDRYAWNGTAFSSVTGLSGESTSGTASIGLTQSTSSTTNYLSSGKLGYTGTAGTKTYLSATDNPYYFYVFPHGSTSPTKLVIKGIFYPKGKTESGGEVMYYPITVNHSQRGTTISVSGGSTYSDGATYPKESTVEANTVYSLGVTINGRGVSSVTDELIPSSVTVNMSVSSWDTVSVSTDFKPALSIGNFLYSDGSYGAYNSSKTAIAVIFSTTTSTTDQGHGWTHGYAMALMNASESCTWGPTTIDTSIPNTASTTTTNIMNNKDGYSETDSIGNNSDYPAFKTALDYKNTITSPSNTSSWYLPSCGQWYDICVNLGGMSKTPDIVVGGYHWTTSNDNYTLLCVNNINKYLTLLNNHGYDIDFFSIIDSPNYWCSSEGGVSGAFHILFGSEGNLGIGSSIQKSCTYKVRPVIAF